jgi:hypothetical protein
LPDPLGPQAHDLRVADREVDVAKHLMRAEVLANFDKFDHRRAHAPASFARNAVTRVSTREPKRDTASTRSPWKIAIAKIASNAVNVSAAIVCT